VSQADALEEEEEPGAGEGWWCAIIACWAGNGGPGPKTLEAGAWKGMPQAWTSLVHGLKLPIHGAGGRWEAPPVPPAPAPLEGADPPLGPRPRCLFLVR
jgi:hypothetical protein